MSPTTIKLMRLSLWVLLVPAVLISVATLVTGIANFNMLWRTEGLPAVILAVVVVIFPALILYALLATQNAPRQLALAFFLCWIFAAFWTLVSFA